MLALLCNPCTLLGAVVNFECRFLFGGCGVSRFNGFDSCLSFSSLRKQGGGVRRVIDLQHLLCDRGPMALLKLQSALENALVLPPCIGLFFGSYRKSSELAGRAQPGGSSRCRSYRAIATG